MVGVVWLVIETLREETFSASWFKDERWFIRHKKLFNVELYSLILCG